MPCFTHKGEPLPARSLLSASVKTACALCCALVVGCLACNSREPLDAQLARIANDGDRTIEGARKTQSAQKSTPKTETEHKDTLNNERYRPAPKLGQKTYDPALDRYTAARGEHTAVLTLHRGMQDELTAQLQEGKVLWGAAVVLELFTGRVLVLAEHSEREPGKAVARFPLAPAASVFKLVSMAALMRAGAPIANKVCYGRGGKRRLAPRYLLPSSKDRRCILGTDIVAFSANVAMGRLADQWLTRELLLDEVQRFGFGLKIWGETTIQASTVTLAPGHFSIAKTAAGFGDVRLGTLHAASLAAVFAQDGRFVAPTLIDGVLGGPLPVRPPSRQVLAPWVAEAIAEMMRDAVRKGTARSYRFLPKGTPLPAGKTGTLMDYERHLDNTWFVGFAPATAPTMAFAVNVINDWNLWHINAKDVARKLLQSYGARRPRETLAELDELLYPGAVGWPLKGP